MILLPTLGVWYVTLLTILFVIVCLFLMLVILIQKPRGGGLSGAFGGAGGSAQSVFGARTGDVLTWFTVICFCLFIGLAMLLTWLARPDITRAGTNIVPATQTTGGSDAGTTDPGAGSGTTGGGAPAASDGDDPDQP